MAITGNPGDLATGGFGTGVRGVAATPRDVANAVARGNAMAAARGGEGGNRATGTGFRGPATTWGSQQSVVPGSALGLLSAQPASPMAPYGSAFDFTPQEYIAAVRSMNKAGLPNASTWDLLGLNAALKKPENIAMSEVLGGPFASDQVAADTTFSVPSGLLGSELSASLPSASTQPVATEQVDTGSFADGLLGSQLAAIKAGENIPAPVSPALTGEGWVDIEPDVNVNSPEVQDLIRMAKAASAQTGQRLTITSGIEPRAAGSLQHPAGLAIDLRAYSPVTGAGLANYQSPETFSQYERVAQAMRAAQQGSFPQYNDTFRWGGYFSGGPETYGALDLMHFDVNNPRGYGMAGGSFETGLTPQMRETWGINAPTSGGPAGPIAVAAAPAPAPAPSPAPASAPVQTVPTPAQVSMAATPTLPPRTPTPTTLGRIATNLFGIPGYDTGPGILGGAAKASEMGTQMLAGAQPQVVDASSAPPAPPVRRPAGEPTRLASLLVDRAIARGEDRRRRRRDRKRSTTEEEMMTDTIGGLLA